MNIELKPCPFCGGQAVLRVEEDDGAFVQCRKCYNKTLSRADRWEESSAVKLVVEAWNRRITDGDGQ